MFWKTKEVKLPDNESTRLPKYFPLVPNGCEIVSDDLFKCINAEATDKLRDLEQ